MIQKLEANIKELTLKNNKFKNRKYNFDDLLKEYNSMLIRQYKLLNDEIEQDLNILKQMRD